MTPAEIKPVWYFTPFYAILRVIPSKGLGVLAMFASIVVLFLVPWLDRGAVKSIRYRGRGYKIALGAVRDHLRAVRLRSARASRRNGFPSCSARMPMCPASKCISVAFLLADLLRLLHFPVGLHRLWVTKKPNRCRSG